MKWLTKSDYLKFLIAPAYLWLAKHAKDEIPPFDDNAQAIVDQGYEVEELAQDLFEKGVRVQEKFAAAVSETADLMQKERVIYQGAVLTQRRLFAQSDILVQTAEGAWDLYEVKSSTKVKPEHISDLAFQKIAWEEYGVPIRKLAVIHVNKEFRLRGQLKAEEFLITTDVTEKVAECLSETKENIKKALSVIASPECPADGPLDCQDYYSWMKVCRFRAPDSFSDDCIFNLTRMNLALAKQLTALGASKIKEIPSELTSYPQQVTQILTAQAGRPIKHLKDIEKILQELRYPLYFLDYETVAPAVPRFEGSRPFEQVPFQYSVHILREPDGELSQREFLARGSSDPSAELLAQLSRDIGPLGQIIVWNKSFEMKVNEDLGKRFPEYRSFLKSLNRRVFDLMDIFADGLYADEKFMGSASIKKVLPVLVPELSYKDLAINEGQTASRRWFQAFEGKLSPEEAEKLYADLQTYCGLDTLAMVRIYEFLHRLVGQRTLAGEQMELLPGE